MKGYISTLIFVLVTTLCFAQVAVIDYMYVKPENEEDYLKIEKIWKKVHQEKVKVGLTMGWYLYKVRFTGTSSPYHYVTLNYYENFEDSENLYFEGIFERAFEDGKSEEIFRRTNEVRDLAKTEVITRLDGIAQKYDNPPKYLYVNYINVEEGQEENYIDIEKYVWKPLHQELYKESKMADWSLWNLWFYSHRNYNYITLNAFYDYKDINTYNYSEIFEKVHQGKDLNEFMKETFEARKSVKTELWELIDFVGSK